MTNAPGPPRHRVLPPPWLAVALGLLAWMLPADSRSEIKLVRGEDRIDVPSRGEGLCLHNLFQSHMVLQRDRPVRIRGWAARGEEVEVTLAGRSGKTTAADDGSWSVEFPAHPASTSPVAMTVRGANRTLALEDILFGDVWVIGGQSNMEHPISRTEDGDIEIASANHPNLRILTVPSQNGPDPRAGFPRLFEWHSFFRTHYRKGDWDICTPEIVEELSGIGYTFARRLHLATGVPIGVIDASRGGTSLETWTPRTVLEETDTPEVRAMLAGWRKKADAYDPVRDLAAQVQAHEQRVAARKAAGEAIPADWTRPVNPRPGPRMDMNHPGNCYANMITPLAGLAVKGAIWHQGYNNAAQPEGHVMYAQLFPRMIAAWRDAFGDPRMPFGIIALCTDGPPQTPENFLEMTINEGQYIRAAQYQTFLDLAAAGDTSIGFASSYDLRRSWYHPQLKIPAAERIARWALNTQHGMHQLPWMPPRITGMRAEGGEIVLTFNTHVGARKDDPIEGFAIAGGDRRFQPAIAKPLVTGRDARGRPRLDHRIVVLSSPDVPEPVHFRYAWGRNPMGNLRHRFDMNAPPLATLRSDRWRIHEVPVRFGDRADRQTLDLARKAHRLFDRERLLKEAGRLIDEDGGQTARALEEWRQKWRPGS